nr:hypothetical protein [Tanacetum cinerariifolium]
DEEDDEIDVEADEEEEEEEHPAPADSVVVASTVADQAPYAEETEPFETDYFVSAVDREIMCDPEREVGYGITDLWDEIVETLQGALVRTDTELGGYGQPGQQGLARDPTQPEPPEEAGGSA